MCGIVGIKGNFSSERCLEIVDRMNQALVHRGPDDAGIWAEDGFGFGMRRLSIIDLAGGHQPMHDAAAGTSIVLNGEIYNYRELRERLRRAGHEFATNSDTEVVLKSLVTADLEGVRDWNGMFAVAAWDSRAK